MLHMLKPIVEQLKGWAEVMLLLQNLTLRWKSMFHFLNRGIPADLLDWLVIVRTKTYAPADMIQILTIRAQVEMNKWF